MTDDNTAKLAELLKKFRIAMLTTVDADGTLTSRPMAVQEAEFDGDLWFFAQRDSRQVEQLHANPDVGVALSSNDAWVSVSGTAEVVDDAPRSRSCGTLRSRLGSRTVRRTRTWCWSRCTPQGARVLGFTGSRVTTLLSYAKSKLTGKRPDVGENERVDL